MMISFSKYPIDVVLCMLCSIILIPIALLDIGDILRIILGLPFIFFIPGYVLIFALFPTKKTEEGIDFIARIALSIGISLVVVALIGFGLNYMPGRIQLETSLLSIFIFIMGIGFIALYRWFKATPDERFTISMELSFKRPEGRLDRTLSTILVVSVIIAAASFAYVIVTPKSVEKFTSFYILGSNGNATDYPRILSVGENATVIIGVANHEYRTINYTIEIWLINQNTVYNDLTNENETIFYNMWFMDKTDIKLDHTPLNSDSSWEYNYTFNISKKGNDFKLIFLLFTTPTEDYIYDKDYRNIAEQKISDAYMENYLWIDLI